MNKLHAAFAPVAPATPLHSRFRYYAVAVGALLIISNGGAAAFADTTDVDINHPLYEYKRLGENVELTFAAPQAKVALYQKFAVRRLHELESMATNEPTLMQEDVLAEKSIPAAQGNQELQAVTIMNADTNIQIAVESTQTQKSLQITPKRAGADKETARAQKEVLKQNIRVRAQKERLDKDLHEAVDKSIDRAEKENNASVVADACKNALAIIKGKRRLDTGERGQWEKVKERCVSFVDAEDENEAE